MTDVILSPNMSLPVPIVGVDAGPQWATDLNSCFALLDQHNHTAGQGVQINPAGLDINDNLPMNGNNLTLVRSVRFSVQASPLSGATDLTCAYSSGVDLYFNDANGNRIQITQNGGIAGSPGSISNLTSPASASYVAADATFVWQSAVNTSANLDAGSVILRNLTANSKGLTLSPPAAMGANYTITLPSLPANQSFTAIDTSGNITAYANVSAGITGAMIGSATVTSTNLASNSVTTAKITDANVTTAKIADAAVTTVKILDANVTTAKIADANVTRAKLDSASNLGLAKCWVNFNAVPLTGTYSQTTTTVTVTMTAHGMAVGSIVNVDITSGTGVDGIYTVATASTNQFTYTAGTSLTTSGNVTRNNYIRASYNVSSTLGITDNGVGDYTINFATAMTDANYVLAGFCNFTSSSPAGLVTAPSTYAPATGSVRFLVGNSAGGTVVDVSYINMLIFGN